MNDIVPDWNGDLILSGTFRPEERVVFDASGDAYTIVKTEANGDFLLHSRDEMESWDGHALPIRENYRIEMAATDRPPVISVISGERLSIIAPRKGEYGTLDKVSVIDLVAHPVSAGPSHSGVGDHTVTVDGKTHVVYIDMRKGQDEEGSPQLIVTYNHDDQTVTQPLLLGFTKGTKNDGPEPNDHNGPAIVSDSQGFLHVVLGSHQQPFKYTVSKRPNDSSAWTPPVEFSNKFNIQETYVGLVIDKADTLHLVSRMVDDDGYSLHYMHKSRNDESWSDRGKLVVPAPRHYSVWYHKLTIDRSSRLFLAYFYYSANLTNEELEAYSQKWPKENVIATETNAHDPVILISNDGGNSWEITTTPNFASPWSWIAVDTPEFSDASGWKDVTNYSTIQTAVVCDELYLLARADRGMQTWKFNVGDNSWSRLAKNSPEWSDASGWNDVTNYSTIQTAVVNNELYLLARADRGMQTWKFNIGDNSWSRLANNSPEWSDASGWKDVTNYSTIQTAVTSDELYLLARSNTGIRTWNLEWPC